MWNARRRLTGALRQAQWPGSIRGENGLFTQIAVNSFKSMNNLSARGVRGLAIPKLLPARGVRAVTMKEIGGAVQNLSVTMKELSAAVKNLSAAIVNISPAIMKRADRTAIAVDITALQAIH